LSATGDLRRCGDGEIRRTLTWPAITAAEPSSSCATWLPRFPFQCQRPGPRQGRALDDSLLLTIAGFVVSLTDLFRRLVRSGYRRDVRAAASPPLAASSPMGLQMTNILKDVWEDRTAAAPLAARRRVCPARFGSSQSARRNQRSALQRVNDELVPLPCAWCQCAG